MKNYIIILSLFLLFSCNNQSSEGLQLNGENPKFMPLSDYFSDHSLIRINLGNELNLAQVTNAIMQDELLYIHDGPGMQVVVVDIEKQIIKYHIRAFGQGPEEYVSLHSMDVDNEHNVYLYDFGRKIMKFKEGEFVQSFNFQSKSRAVSFQTDAFILFNPDYSYNNVNNSIIKIDLQGNNAQPLGKSRIVNDLRLPGRLVQRLSSSRLAINDFNSNTLVILNENNIPEYFKFSHHNDTIDPLLVDFILFKNQAVVTLGYETNDQLYAEAAIFDLKTKESNTLSGFFNDLNGLHVQSFNGFSSEEDVLFSIFTEESISGLINMLDESFLKTYFEENGDAWSPKDQSDIKLKKETVSETKKEIERLISEEGNYLMIQLLK